MELWSLFQEQILGMKWLNEWLGRGLSALGLDIHGRLGGSVQFFLYDVLKITVLLCLLIFLISYVQSYFPPERSKKIMGRFHGLWANCVPAPRRGRQSGVRPAGDGDALLLLLVHPAVHRFYQRGAAPGRHLFLSDLLADGGLGQSGAADEHLWD